MQSIIRKSLSLLTIPCALASMAWGASHSDAPLIKQDPQANITDVYAFIGTKYDNASIKVLNVLVQTRPFSEPGDGVIYDRFADDALYSIHITNPTTGATINRYDFQFSDINPTTAPGLKNPDTVLSYGRGTEVGPVQTVGDARQNFSQTYGVKKDGASIGSNLSIPPPNVGPRTTPAYNDPTSGKAVSGATTHATLDSYTRTTIHSLATGEAVFAGPRDDGFYSDIPGIFDLLDPRLLDNNGISSDGLGQDGNGDDGFKGFNVLSICIQIPVSSLPSLPFSDPFFGAANGVGVYASVSRPQTTTRSASGEPTSSGGWIQVNRMGNPLFNEGLVALKDKDNFNRTSPTNDTAYEGYALNPEIAVLINAVFGTSFATTGRVDLKAVFIPDVLRVNTATNAVRLPGQAGYSRLGFIGGDTTSGVNSGWPNGRRIGDDVVDIALTAVASGPSYSTVTVVGDNVSANDQVYHRVFPYLATPHAGSRVDQRQAPQLLANPTNAIITSPAPGSTIGSSNVTFTWTTPTGATEYYLTVGSFRMGYNLFSRGTTSNSIVVPSLPRGAQVFATLYTRINGRWQERTPFEATYTVQP